MSERYNKTTDDIDEERESLIDAQCQRQEEMKSLINMEERLAKLEASIKSPVLVKKELEEADAFKQSTEERKIEEGVEAIA